MGLGGIMMAAKNMHSITRLQATTTRACDSSYSDLARRSGTKYSTAGQKLIQDSQT